MKEAIENVEKSEHKAEELRLDLVKLFDHQQNNLAQLKQLDGANS